MLASALVDGGLAEVFLSPRDDTESPATATLDASPCKEDNESTEIKKPVSKMMNKARL